MAKYARFCDRSPDQQAVMAMAMLDLWRSSNRGELWPQSFKSWCRDMARVNPSSSEFYLAVYEWHEEHGGVDTRVGASDAAPVAAHIAGGLLRFTAMVLVGIAIASAWFMLVMPFVLLYAIVAGGLFGMRLGHAPLKFILVAPLTAPFNFVAGLFGVRGPGVSRFL